jgi:hypothetical protein
MSSATMSNSGEKMVARLEAAPVGLDPLDDVESSVPAVLASSTVIIPSLPTFFVASPMILPIALSPLVEIVPTWAISSEDCSLLARQQAAFGAGASREPWARLALGLVVRHGEAILKGVKAYSLPIARKGAANGAR